MSSGLSCFSRKGPWSGSSGTPEWRLMSCGRVACARDPATSGRSPHPVDRAAPARRRDLQLDDEGSPVWRCGGVERTAAGDLVSARHPEQLVDGPAGDDPPGAGSDRYLRGGGDGAGPAAPGSPPAGRAPWHRPRALRPRPAPAAGGCARGARAADRGAAGGLLRTTATVEGRRGARRCDAACAGHLSGRTLRDRRRETRARARLPRPTPRADHGAGPRATRPPWQDFRTTCRGGCMRWT